jgi:hypothetical protein
VGAVEERVNYDRHRGFPIRCEKLVDLHWVATAIAPNLTAAFQHAQAIGGQVRAVNIKTHEPVSYWCEGELVG